jgi:predicted MFS family arabinose efflux permease
MFITEILQLAIFTLTGSLLCLTIVLILSALGAIGGWLYLFVFATPFALIFLALCYLDLPRSSAAGASSREEWPPSSF